MTPVVKGVLTDLGFDNAVKAQQMFGGHGYIEEWGMSQFVRDARIAMIYEGANGIQAMDLVGRKLGKDGGRAVMAFFNEVGAFCQENAGDESLKPYIAPLQQGLGHLQQATMWFMQNAMAKPDNAGAGATDYMHLFGLVAHGLYVGEDGEGRAGARRREGNGVAEQDGRQAPDRPLLHGAHDARDRDAPRPHHHRRRHDDGDAGGGVLRTGVIPAERSEEPGSPDE